MSKDPAFLFYPGDYLRDTQCLSEKSQVAYDRIICEHMRNICISKQQLNFFTKRLSPDEVEELKMVLSEVDGGYQIEWVTLSIIKRKAYTESRRQNRTKSEKNICKTYVKHMENENENENTIVKEDINRAVIKDIVNDLNAVLCTNFKHTTKKTRELIAARIKDGFTVEDFKTVHRKKANEWQYDNKMVKFLRPETLYGNKFESYLNQKEVRTLTKAQQGNIESFKRWEENTKDEA